MRLRGDIDIELIDVVTGDVETHHETNMMTNAVNEILNSNPFAVFYNAMNSNDGVAWYSAMLPMCPNMIGGILLFPNTLQEDAANTYQYSDNMPVAYASNDVNATANVARGSMNLTESMPIENGYKFVWEFTAGQGNGTIAALGLTSADGGKNAYGSIVDDSSIKWHSIINEAYGEREELLPELTEALEKALLSGNKAEIDGLTKQMKNLQKKIVSLTDEVDQERVGEEIRSIRERINELRSTDDDYDEEQKRLEEMIAFLKSEGTAIREYDDSLVRKFIDCIMVYDYSIAIRFKTGKEISMRV